MSELLMRTSEVVRESEDEFIVTAGAAVVGSLSAAVLGNVENSILVLNVSLLLAMLAFALTSLDRAALIYLHIWQKDSRGGEMSENNKSSKNKKEINVGMFLAATTAFIVGTVMTEPYPIPGLITALIGFVEMIRQVTKGVL